ncbi:MAG: endonuclease, partial [Candidatus Onthovivens sp.]|nr:endonuclease [Candidatus Onthovivens sp.]
YMWTVYFAERNTPITNVAESIKTMIEWHKADPVDACEILRNNKVESSVQKNRNPFVDHPEWVDVIFG